MKEWIYLRSKICFWLFFQFFHLAFAELLQCIRIVIGKVPDLKELSIYLNYVERVSTFKGLKFHHYKILWNSWLNCASYQRLSKVFPASRLAGRALCKNTYPLKPNLFAESQDLPTWHRPVQLKRSIRRDNVFQNQEKIKV